MFAPPQRADEHHACERKPSPLTWRQRPAPTQLLPSEVRPGRRLGGAGRNAPLARISFFPVWLIVLVLFSCLNITMAAVEAATAIAYLVRARSEIQRRSQTRGRDGGRSGPSGGQPGRKRRCRNSIRARRHADDGQRHPSSSEQSHTERCARGPDGPPGVTIGPHRPTPIATRARSRSLKRGTLARDVAASSSEVDRPRAPHRKAAATSPGRNALHISAAPSDANHS